MVMINIFLMPEIRNRGSLRKKLVKKLRSEIIKLTELTRHAR